jgi:broad specificity phosphatase PhoE
VYSSPLRRAYDTATAVADSGLAPVRICPALQEIDCGVLDGLPIDEVQRRFPDVWAADLSEADDRFRWPGGESYREFRCRCLRAIRAIARAHQDANVAVVTHAGVVTQIVGALQGISPARWAWSRPATTALTEIVWERGTGSVVTFDDHSHLGVQTTDDAR